MRQPRRIVAATVAATALLALSSCTEDKAATVKEQADSDTSAEIVDDSTPDATEDAADGDAPSTAALGDLVTVGDWDVKVTKVVLNAAAEIEKANEFNDPAKGQWVLVTYEATYNGSERSADAFFDLTWTITGADQQIIEEGDAVTPTDTAENPTETRAGGTVTTQVVFDVPKAQLPGALLTVEGYDASFDTVYADFPLS